MPSKARETHRSFRSEARSAPAVVKALVQFGKRIRELRLALGYTQEQVAERAKLDAKHVQAMESGKSNATIATIVALAKALHVTVAELFAAPAKKIKSSVTNYKSSEKHPQLALVAEPGTGRKT